ncbi:MAG: fluoride efflux transporter CrcB [Planctomycetota bacterium]
MNAAVLVFVGGGLGALGRYGLALWLRPDHDLQFPWATFAANLIGCLAIGLASGLLEDRIPALDQVEWFLVVGLLGGFTTFSSFGLETHRLLVRGAPLMALLYAGASLVLGLALCWLGYRLARG